MNDRHSSKLAAAGRYALAVAAGGYLLAYVAIALWRLQHPFELEWMEGAMVDHVQRITEGKRLYVPPSLDFVPFIYPPLFYYASAAVAQITGVGFAALRLVSFLSSLLIFALLYLLVARETRDRFAALIATGLFAATYQIGGAFFDLGRVDSLFLATLLAAVYVLRFGESLAAHAAGGLLIGLAFLTKQSAVVMAAPLVLYVIHRHPRRGLATAAVAGAVMVGATVWIDAVHDGWYAFYAFEIPSGYQMLRHRLLDFWTVDILPPLAISWAVGLAFLVAPGAGRPRMFYLAVAAGMIAGSWLSRGNPGGYDNVLIPAFLASAILFGLGLHSARAALSAPGAEARARGEVWLGAACLLQFALLVYNPLYMLPTRADVAAGEALVRTVAAVEGDVWIPYHGNIGTMASKGTHAHWMAISDILESGRAELRERMEDEIEAALGTGRFDLVVQSSHPFLNAPKLQSFYALEGKAVDDPDVFWPVTGARRRAETLYVPKQPPPSAVDGLEPASSLSP